ncbi:hypothetical protein [Actinoplanes sp. NBRC 103695]|uniref:hypothetical protein n=1 Tax=Actinoplanes sp. NBRC 103695 TaxID=3032202 RepID=UPI002557754D|nr:hypothetical protein [Actinoplanes sp. NBRC 103695]
MRSLALAGVAYVELTGAATVDLALATRTGESSPAVRRVADMVAALTTRRTTAAARALDAGRRDG